MPSFVVRVLLFSSCALLMTSWSEPAAAATTPVQSPAQQRAVTQAHSIASREDPHSYADAANARVEHLDLALAVDFAHKRLTGTVDLRVQRKAGVRELFLDTRDIDVQSVAVLDGKGAATPAKFQVGARDRILGSPLRIELPASGADTLTVRVAYRTQPPASGLQWVEPRQTAGREHPFLYSQSQAIHARSWIPLQDSPSVRFTYTAKIQVPPKMTAVMSASRIGTNVSPEQRFEMKQAIPSYLMALGVGDLVFRPTGPRTGVWAEPSVSDAATKEFADTEKMLEVGEKLFGPYRWERYELLILPPSFPFGGMENPRLSFITPTAIAGDRSLTSLIAHELAHSWSGNLVTNATWRDFWLNEGFTTFLERRIVDALYGKRRLAMEESLGVQSLEEDFGNLPESGRILAIDLRKLDPDNDGFSQVPYEKGFLFLRYLESKVGRERFDAFLREYFDRFAFQSITTADVLEFIRTRLLRGESEVSNAKLQEWVTQPGLPGDAVIPKSDALAKVDEQRDAWLAGTTPAAQLKTSEWTTQEWLHFIDNMPKQLTPQQMAEVDKAFGFTRAGNSEIAHSWLRVAIRNHYEPAMPRLREYLVTIGRRKLIKPLYEDLMKQSWGPPVAKQIYAEARPGYHPMAVTTLDPIVNRPKSAEAEKK
jgi:leukotriene-A4 hydrolase